MGILSEQFRNFEDESWCKSVERGERNITVLIVAVLFLKSPINRHLREEDRGVTHFFKP